MTNFCTFDKYCFKNMFVSWMFVFYVQWGTHISDGRWCFLTKAKYPDWLINFLLKKKKNLLSLVITIIIDCIIADFGGLVQTTAGGHITLHRRHFSGNMFDMSSSILRDSDFYFSHWQDVSFKEVWLKRTHSALKVIIEVEIHGDREMVKE